MRTLRGPSRTLKSLHRTVSTSDVPVVTRRHTRVGIRCRPMCFPSARRCPRETLERQARSGFDLRVIGPSCGLPVRARRAEPGNAFFRIDSLRAMNPQTAPRSLWIESPCARTVSPSVHPRPASDGATDFFQASALAAPRGLATSWRERRAMRPTDICHPDERRAPAPRVFPARSRRSRGGDAPRSLGLRTA
jgi:hypothetical protein